MKGAFLIIKSWFIWSSFSFEPIIQTYFCLFHSFPSTSLHSLSCILGFSLGTSTPCIWECRADGGGTAATDTFTGAWCSRMRTSACYGCWRPSWRVLLNSSCSSASWSRPCRSSLYKVTYIKWVCLHKVKFYTQVKLLSGLNCKPPGWHDANDLKIYIFNDSVSSILLPLCLKV